MHTIHIFRPDQEILAGKKGTKAEKQKLKKYMGTLNNQLLLHQTKSYPSEIADKLHLGYAIIPAELSTPDSHGKIVRQAQCVTTKSLFGVDFDNDCANKMITFEQVRERADSIGGFCIAYDSLSSRCVDKETGKKLNHRFRIFFQLEKPVGREDAELIQKKLMIIFPEADTACSDLARLFFGTDRKKHYEFDDEKYLDCSKLDVLTAGMINTTSKHNANRVKKNLCLAKQTTTQIDAAAKQICVSWKDAANRCLLINQFISGEELNHNQEIMLGIFAKHTKGGTKWFNRHALTAAGNDKDVSLKRIGIINASFDAGHHLWGCEKGDCPYIAQCQNPGNNIVTKIKMTKMSVRKNADPVIGLTMQQGMKKLSHAMTAAYKSKTHISIIKADTGIGKTKLYCKLAQPGDIICTPTHQLDKTIAAELTKLGKDYIISTDRPALPTKKQNEINKLRQIGLDLAAAVEWKKYVDWYKTKYADTGYTPQMQACIDWIVEQAQLKTTTKIIICTHAKLQYINNSYTRTVWIDEDPLSTMLIDSTAISDYEINQLVSLINNNKTDYEAAWSDAALLQTITDKYKISYDTLKKMQQHLQQIHDDSNKIVITPAVTFSQDEQKEINRFVGMYKRAICGPVTKLFGHCEKLVAWSDTYHRNKTVYAIASKTKMICDPMHKYIIMSATISPEMYCKYVFPTENIAVYDINLINKGDIRLYTKLSTSNTNIDEALLKYIDKTCGKDINLLTFKSRVEEFLNYGFWKTSKKMYLLNAEGYNNLENEDLIIAGTPYANIIRYIITAAAIGIDIGQQDIMMHNRLISRNGYDFYCMTFQNEILREIQLQDIDAELIQACGRARANRNADVTVHIFGRYPIPGAKIMD